MEVVIVLVSISDGSFGTWTGIEQYFTIQHIMSINIHIMDIPPKNNKIDTV